MSVVPCTLTLRRTLGGSLNVLERSPRCVHGENTRLLFNPAFRR